MAWVLLAFAIASEVVSTSLLKAAEGFTRLVPSIGVVIGYVLSIYLLVQALKLQMQVSIAYAIWSGAGTAAIAVIGMAFLHEPLTLPKSLGIMLIIAGAVVLNLSGSH